MANSQSRSKRQRLSRKTADDQCRNAVFTDSGQVKVRVGTMNEEGEGRQRGKRRAETGIREGIGVYGCAEGGVADGDESVKTGCVSEETGKVTEGMEDDGEVTVCLDLSPLSQPLLVDSG